MTSHSQCSNPWFLMFQNLFLICKKNISFSLTTWCLLVQNPICDGQGVNPTARLPVPGVAPSPSAWRGAGVDSPWPAGRSPGTLVVDMEGCFFWFFGGISASKDAFFRFFFGFLVSGDFLVMQELKKHEDGVQGWGKSRVSGKSSDWELSISTFYRRRWLKNGGFQKQKCLSYMGSMRYGHPAMNEILNAYMNHYWCRSIHFVF